MNRIICGLLITASLLFLSEAITEGGVSQGRILVLGFDSRLLNDIQDRLLREMLIRELMKRRYAIVPIMEIESVFGGDSRRDIRKLNERAIRRSSSELNARYVLYGTLISEGENRHSCEIAEGRYYYCILKMFDRKKDSFKRITLKISGEKDLYKYFSLLTNVIIRGFESFHD